ncbi:DUF3153 domain-containing protein [Nodosilinea sp. LEGE 07088]|uniref:DUF3153 domain-containing protein n=1 Tax=Nodosilinea sp. LEGE 07088 TaxID=2777968 RepID=UPI001D139E81|nr:DUF3153 domain-containing protein [Nodosilinea sp. LEGE 07088]
MLRQSLEAGRLWWRWLALALLPLLLSGCLRYDLTLRFDHHTHGQISQTIALSERGAALANPTLTPWLEELERRSRPFRGQLNHRTDTATLTIPFSTAADLVDRFEQIFVDQPDGTPSSAVDATYLRLPGWEAIPVTLKIEQTSWGLASFTHLTYCLDLSSLPTSGETLTDAAPWADLRLRLQVPWGLAQVSPRATPPISQDAAGATWQLQPGQTIDIDVAFWLPNAVGLGTLGIVALVLAGYGLRYRLFKPKSDRPLRSP